VTSATAAAAVQTGIGGINVDTNEADTTTDSLTTGAGTESVDRRKGLWMALVMGAVGVFAGLLM